MKDIQGYNGDYKITKNGEVWSFKRDKPRKLKKRISPDGYVWYNLSMNGNQYTERTNRLVAEAYIPNPDNKNTVNHIDGDKLNNHVSNLEWATRSEQMEHAYNLGLKKPMEGVKSPVSKLTEGDVIEIRSRYKNHCKINCMIPLAKEFGVSQSTINKCVRRVTYRNIK